MILLFLAQEKTLDPLQFKKEAKSWENTDNQNIGIREFNKMWDQHTLYEFRKKNLPTLKGSPNRKLDYV